MTTVLMIDAKLIDSDPASIFSSWSVCPMSTLSRAIACLMSEDATRIFLGRLAKISRSYCDLRKKNHLFRQNPASILNTASIIRTSTVLISVPIKQVELCLTSSGRGYKISIS